MLAAQKKYEAARQRPSQAGSLPDPTFSPGWNSNGNPLPGAGIGREPTSNIGFSVTQEVLYPGKQRLRSNLARKEADVEFEDLQLAQLGVISRVKQAFFRLQHSYAARDVLERNRQLLKNLLSVTEVRYSAGKAAQQDVFKAQVQLSVIEAKILQLDRERRLRQAEINSLLNRRPDTPLGKPGEPHVKPVTKTLTELQAAARESAPTRLRDQKMTERAELAVNLARKDYYPDYALTAGYFNQAGMPAFYMFRADIRIPLYFKGKQRAALTERTEMLSEARHTYDATGQSLNFRIADDYSMAETSLQLANLYFKTVMPQAQLAVDSSLASYETGTVDFLSVLNNYTAALEYEMDYHEEMLNYHLALSRLEETTGVRLIEGGHL
ncbi:MAG TPA: TolC family protein [Bryobacteraceae bacterium]|nr:TolC family protein [Bryobacteraceae bacterium]